MESNFDNKLKEIFEKSVWRLLSSEVYDEAAFKELLSYLEAKAENIKNEHVISKQVLQVLTQASSAIESRAEYLPEVKKHLEVAKEFESLMYLIIAGEAPSDQEFGRL